MASDKQIRRMVDEVEKLKREIINLKSKVRRRVKKLGKTFDPLERARIEFEIELLKRKIQRWQIVEITLSIPLIKAINNFSGGKSEGEFGWNKAGRA